LVNYHRKKDSVLTITSVGAGQKFGVLDLDGNNMVKAFREKNDNDGSMINAGFMVCEPTLFDYLHDDQTVLEREPFETLASQGKLDAYRHQGFWHCMDTKRDKDQLEEMWASGNAPWKVWDR
jgi:glucose-1-phosphate cytidylyltransferase